MEIRISKKNFIIPIFEFLRAVQSDKNGRFGLPVLFMASQEVGERWPGSVGIDDVSRVSLVNRNVHKSM